MRLGGGTRQNRTKPRGAAGSKRATHQAGRKLGGARGRSHEPDQSAVTGFLRRNIEKRAPARRPWQSPVTGHLVWDRDDDIALLVPLLDVSVGFGDLL